MGGSRPEGEDLRTTKELFLEALEQVGAEREELLARVRSADPDRGERVERLLASHVEEDRDWTLGVSEIAREAFEAEKGGPAAGTRIGDYELLEEVGAGASGVVWRARQVSLGRTVAVKLLRHGRLAGTREIERFRSEAETVARLDHPSIVHVHEVGEVRGGPFFSMRWIDGEDLAARTGSAWAPRRAASFLVPVARAVHYAHQRGLLHRDLKPSNILIDAQNGEPHVADFGVARRIDAADTASSGPVGTPLYMAPEQVAGEQELTVGTDVWALGCILHEMLSGSPAFASDTLPELYYRISEGEPARLGSHVPRDLQAIVQTCLRKDPSDRYASAEALAADLERWLNHEPVQARRVRLLERAALAWRRSPVAVGLTALVVLLVVVIAIGASWSTMRLRQGLRDSLLREARATRLSKVAGSRGAALELVTEAAGIRPGKDLRDEVVAILAHTGVRLAAQWPMPWKRMFLVGFDSELERYAWVDEAGALFVSRARSGELELSLPSPGPVAGVSFSGGDLLCVRGHGVDGGGWLAVWNLADVDAPVFEAPECPRSGAFAVCPDGERVAYGGEGGELVVAQLSTGEELLRTTVPGPVSALCLRPDGGALVCATEEEEGFVLRLVPIDGSGRELLITAPDYVFDLDWTRDGSRVVLASADRNAHVWRPVAEAELRALRGHDAEVVVVDCSPSHPIAMTYGWDEKTRLWDILTGEEILVTDTQASRFDRTGRFLACRTSETLGVLELEHEDVLRTLHGHEGKSPRRVMFGRDGKTLLSTGGDGVLRWDLDAGTAESLLPADVEMPTFLEDRDRYLCLREGRLEMHALSDPEWFEVVAEGPVSHFATTPDGKGIVVKHGAECRVLFRGAQRPDVIIPVPPAAIRLCVTRDCRWLAAGTWHGTGVHVWDAFSGERVAELFAGAPSATARFSPNGRHLAVGLPQEYVLLRVGTWDEVWRVERRRSMAGGGGPLTFSADSRLFACAQSAGIVSICDVQTGAALVRLEPPVQHGLGVIAFSPDGARLAFAVPFIGAFVWDLAEIRRRLVAAGLEAW